MRKYKLFCVVCDWSTQERTDKELYKKYAKCPQCGGCTDAVEEK